MDTLKENAIEEEEFESLTPFEQQRFTSKLQYMEECFREVNNKLKENYNDAEFFDALVLEFSREEFDDQISRWTHFISTWENRNSEQKYLGKRLHKEIDDNSNKFMKIYFHYKEELDKRKTRKKEERHEHEKNINDPPELERNENDLEKERGSQLNDAVMDIEEVKGENDLEETTVEKLELESEGELHHLVTKLENQIEELNVRIEYMFKANQVVGENIETIKHENITLKELNKCLQNEIVELKVTVDSERKRKDELSLKNESLVKSLLPCDKCRKTLTDNNDFTHHMRAIYEEQEFKCDLCG